MSRFAGYGSDAIRVGTPDFGRNGHDVDGTITDATDAVANILHFVDAATNGDSSAIGWVLDGARDHYYAERGE